MNIKVLLIDDELKLLEALSNYLETKGISVWATQSVQGAFKILKNNIPDLMIIDVIMPEKTGYEFISELKANAQFNTIPFIFLTAKGMTKDRIQGYQFGCRAYIAKPFDPEELISIINNIVIETRDIKNIKQIKNEIKKIRLFLETKNTNYIQLTPREKLVLFEIIKGKSIKTIGKKIHTTERNVEKYITRLLNKTGSQNRTELLKFSYKFYRNLRANDENRTRE